MKQIEIDLIKGLLKDLGCNGCPVFDKCQRNGQGVCDVLYGKLRNYRKK